MPSDQDQKRVEFEKAMAAELARQELERKEQEQGQAKARADLLRAAQERGREGLELEELRKSVEKQELVTQRELAERQQRRRDELELLYLGPPSERERGGRDR